MYTLLLGTSSQAAAHTGASEAGKRPRPRLQLRSKRPTRALLSAPPLFQIIIIIICGAAMPTPTPAPCTCTAPRAPIKINHKMNYKPDSHVPLSSFLTDAIQSGAATASQPGREAGKHRLGVT